MAPVGSSACDGEGSARSRIALESRSCSSASRCGGRMCSSARNRGCRAVLLGGCYVRGCYFSVAMHMDVQVCCFFYKLLSKYLGFLRFYIKLSPFKGFFKATPGLLKTSEIKIIYWVKIKKHSLKSTSI